MRRRAWLVLAALAACADPKTAAVDDVIVTFEGPASVVADGTTAAQITVCTTDQPRLGDLKATLTLTDGTWSDAMGAMLVIDLVAAPCDERAFVPPDHLGTIQARATILGFTKTISIATTGAQPSDARIAIDAPLHTGQAGQTQVSVTPVLVHGRPTAGTFVRYGVTATPAGSAFVTAPVAALAMGTATATVFATADATSVRVTADVFAPDATDPDVSKAIDIPIVP